VWDYGKKSRLIESILLRIPLPIIYVAEDENNRLSVIDGQQRLWSIIKYMRNDYALKGLNVLTNLKNKKFLHLDGSYQRLFRSSTMRFIEIKKESDPSIRFQLFERLNKGAMSLNAQEIRNCAYRGAFNDKLKELEVYCDWFKLMRLNECDKRMRDRELILRFFALYDRYNHYRGSMKVFLDKEMEEQQNAQSERLKQYEALFKKVTRMALSVLGDKAFERFVQGNKEDPNGHFEGKINYALFDAIMFCFAQYEERDIIPRGEAIFEALIELMTNNECFIYAITQNTSQKNTLRTRISIFENELRNITGGADTSPRIFPFSLKKQLFDQNPTCDLCKNRIVLIHDAQVHHEQPYSHLGLTSLSNARLTHRYCNIAHGNRN